MSNQNKRSDIIDRLRRGRTAREQFTASHISKTVAFQLRATRDKLGWSQERLAKEAGMNQNAISRLESPVYGKPTLTTLKRLAKAMDVGLIVRFVPFSEMVDWVSGTPHVSYGLTSEALAVPAFAAEETTEDEELLALGFIQCSCGDWRMPVEFCPKCHKCEMGCCMCDPAVL